MQGYNILEVVENMCGMKKVGKGRGGNAWTETKEELQCKKEGME